MKSIIIRGAREHNLKNIDLEIPRDALVVVSGLSGSGKSSLAFDTIFAEGQRRYVESLSAYARQFLGRLDKPDVDSIEGLSPAIAIEQKTTHRNPRSTVGTVTEIYDYLRLLFARVGIPHCPQCGREIQEQSVDQIVDALLVLPQGTKVSLLAPVVGAKKGEHQKVLEDARRLGYVRVRVDGEMRTLDEPIELDKQAQALHRDRRGPARHRPRYPAARRGVGRGRPGRVRRDADRPRAGEGRRAGDAVLAEEQLSRVRDQRAGAPAAAFLLQQSLRRLPRVHGAGHDPRVRPGPRHPRQEPVVQRGGDRAVQPPGQLVPQPVRGAGPAFPLQPRHADRRAAARRCCTLSCTGRARRSTSAT